jgi:gas vesicle protein
LLQIINLMRTGKALLGILAGIAAGAIIGMLLAPDKTDRLKKNISKKSADLADAINEKIDEKFEELLKRMSAKVKKGKGEQSSADAAEV